MDESRKQFEEWVLSRPEAEHDDIVMRSGEYLRILTTFMWETWQASREAIEIEVPDVEKWRSVDAVRAQTAYKSSITAELSAAGIKVKE